MTDLLSEKLPVMATLDPVSQAAATVTSDWASMANAKQMLFILSVGALGALATVDFKLQQATSSAGANAKDITGKAVTQLTKAGNDDNKQVLIGVRADELDLANGFSHVAGVVTVANAACLISLVGIGGEPRYAPVDGIDLASVDEIIN